MSRKNQNSHKAEDEDSQSGRDRFTYQPFNLAGPDHSARAQLQHSGQIQLAQPAEQTGPVEPAELPAEQVLKVNPHALVALQAVVNGSPLTDKKHNSGKYSTPISNIIYNDHGPMNARTAVLDAIASIAIYKPKGQEVAVAMQIDHEKERICLTIAENDTVPDEVIKHIEKVWEILREMSDEFARHRNLETQRGYREKSPGIPVIPITLEIMQRIGTEVYRFSSRKLIARSKKRIAVIWEFTDAICTALEDGSLGGNEQDKVLQECLLKGLYGLVIAYNWDTASNKQLLIQDWVEFYKYIAEATRVLDQVLDRPHALERWAEHLGFGKCHCSLWDPQVLSADITSNLS
jgi:hypothetical protein